MHACTHTHTHTHVHAHNLEGKRGGRHTHRDTHAHLEQGGGGRLADIILPRRIWGSMLVNKITLLSLRTNEGQTSIVSFPYRRFTYRSIIVSNVTCQMGLCSQGFLVLHVELYLLSLRMLSLPQSSGAVWVSRWTSWAPIPNKPTVSVDVKQHWTISEFRSCVNVEVDVLGSRP